MSTLSDYLAARLALIAATRAANAAYQALVDAYTADQCERCVPVELPRRVLDVTV